MMKATMLTRLRRKEALLLGASAMALLSTKATAANVSVTDGGTLTLTTNVTNDYYFQDSTGAGTLTINDGVAVTGLINTDTGTGTGSMVIFSGSSTITGTIGAATTIGTLQAGATGSNVQFDSNTTAIATLLTNSGSITLGTGASISGLIVASTSTTGELVFAGNGTVGGNIADATGLSTITAGLTNTTAQFEGDVTAVQVALTGDGTVVLAAGKSIGGAIEQTGTVSTGELIFNGDSTVSGTIGATNSLGTIRVDGATTTSQFDSDVVSGSILVSQAGTVLFSNGASLAGVVDALATTGVLLFGGSSTISGTIGASTLLGTVSAGATTSNVQFDGDVTTNVLLFTSEGSVTLKDGVSIGGLVTTSATGGEMVFAGSGTVSGNIGDASGLGTITAGVSTSNVQFDGDVTTTAILLTSTGSVTLATGKTIAGIVATSTANTGELVFAGDGTVSGNIADTSGLSTIKAGLTGTTAQFDGDVTAVQVALTGDGTVTVAAGKSIGGAVEQIGTVSTGELIFAGDSTVSGTIGATNSLGTIRVSGTTTTSQFDSDVVSGSILVSDTGTVLFSSGASLAGVVDALATTGVLLFGGSSTISGTIGASTLLGTVSAGATTSNVQFDGDVTTNVLLFTSEGSVTVKDGVSIGGVVTTSATGGEMVFAGSSTVAGNVGDASGLGTITAGVSTSNVQFDGDVTTTAILLTSTGSVTLATGKTIAGIVASSTASTGELVFAGDGTVSGNIADTSGLSTIKAGLTGTTAQFDGDVTAVQIALTGDGTVTVANGKTIGGSVDQLGTVSTGELIFAGNGTISGTIGATNSLGTIGAAVTGTDTQFDGDVTAGQITMSQDGSIILATGKSISGNIISLASASNGNVVFSGDATLGGDIGAAAGSGLISLAAGVASTTTQFDGTSLYAENIALSTGTTKFTNSGSLAGVVNVADGGNIDVGAKTITVEATRNGQNSTITFGGTGTTLNMAIISATSFGSITSANTFTAANGKVYVDTSGATGYIASGQTFKIVGATTLNTPNVTVSTNSAAVTFTPSNAANELILTASRTGGGYAGAASGGATSQVSGLSTALGNLGSSATGSMATLLGKLDAMTASDLGQALTQMAPPSMNGASVAAASQVSNVVGNVVQARVAMLQGHQVASAEGVGFEPASGVSAGSGVKRHGAWVQVLGSFGDQGTRKNVDGYDATTYGMALGADTAINDKLRAGLAFSYANTAIEDKGARNGNTTDVNSYMLNLYGTYDVTSAIYVDGGVTFGLHQYDTKRVSSLLSAEAKGDFSGYQYGVNTRVGYKVPLAAKALLTPFVSMDYTRLDQDGYTETGTGGLPLKVDSQSFDSLKIGGGARLSGEFKKETVRLLPEVHGGVFYDTLAGKTHTTATFTGGGSSFRVDNVEPAKTSFNAGVGLSVVTASDLAITVTYDADMKEDYSGHTGAMKVRMPF